MAKQSKSIIKIIIIGFIVLIVFDILINPGNVFNNILDSLKLWLFKVYPPIFLFYILSSLIINLNFIDNKAKILSKLFHFKNFRSYSIFTMSLLIGNPATSALILENIHTENIDIEDGNHLLCISSFLNPLFIISFMSSKFLYLKYSLLIIFIHIISNFIIGLVMFINKNNTILIKQKRKKENNIIKDFFDSIERANFLLLKICGIMIICNLCKHSLYSLLFSLNIKGVGINILLSLIEVASGLNDIVNLQLPQNLVLCLVAFLVSFGGLSIHLQVYSIISNSSLEFKKFFYFRIIQGLLSFLLCFILLNIKFASLNYILIILILIISIVILLKNFKRQKPSTQ